MAKPWTADHWECASLSELHHIMEHDAVRKQLARHRALDESHDIPFVGGYSQNGETIYLHRHLAKEIDIDGRKVCPRKYLKLHEEMEKSLIDVLGWGYLQSHRISNAIELLTVVQDGMDKSRYIHFMDKEMQRLMKLPVKVIPNDLDFLPYHTHPINTHLLHDMHNAKKHDHKLSKDSVNYTPHGKASEHCGPTFDWPNGYCSHYGDHDCDIVHGLIEPKGWCKKFKRAKNAAA